MIEGRTGILRRVMAMTLRKWHEQGSTQRDHDGDLLGGRAGIRVGAVEQSLVVRRNENAHAEGSTDVENDETKDNGLERPGQRFPRVCSLSGNHRDVLWSAHAEPGDVDCVYKGYKSRRRVVTCPRTGVHPIAEPEAAGASAQ